MLSALSLMEILSSHVAILNLLCEFKFSSMHAQMNEDKFLNRLVTVGWGLSGPVCIQTGLRVFVLGRRGTAVRKRKRDRERGRERDVCLCECV